MSPTMPLRIAAMLIVTASSANAQFTGAYAPDTWTVTGAGLGPSAAVFATDGSSLTITGPDLVAGEIDVTHTVALGGTWSFDWMLITLNTSTTPFDNAYYLLNDTPVFLGIATIFGPPVTGSVSIPVASGDVIGWRVDSFDGTFGPAVLTITNFQIPAPGVVFLLSLAGIARARRRRG